MSKRNGLWILVAMFALGAAMVGCEEKEGAFREMPEDGPPPALNLPDPGDPNANPATSIAAPPPQN